MLKKAESLLPFFGIAIFIALIWLIGPWQIVSAALSANPALLLLAACMIVPVSLIQAYKWYYLIKKQNKGSSTGIEISFMQALRYYFIGMFYSAITPAKLGSFIRIRFLQKKSGKPLGTCSSSVVLDRMLDILALFLLAFAGSLFFLNKFSGLIAASFSALVTLVFFIWFFSSKERSRFLLSIIGRRLIPNKFGPNASEMFNSFYLSLPHRRDIAFSFFLSFASRLLTFTQTFIVALALGLSFEYFYFLAAISVVGIIALLPITINGLGTGEVAHIVLLSPFNALPAGIVVMSLLSGLFLTYLSAAIGAIFTFSEPEPVGKGHEEVGK
ncbi:MAG: lysylphosphatidylglycerol synthase transmembrane domain-containing protein [Candidatus Diapherotrites archaeon]|nr:flippase-like domain-containing protein [Candidatus Micrarchaeota archaeon]MBU1939810.1 flippase-like domain-containing protein [Candidatus Micrarchaeota archaeon]